MKSLASGYSKTVVLHWMGCIFQGFQYLQKVGKTAPDIVSKCPQTPLKSGSEGFKKRSLKMQGKINTIWWKMYPQWGLGKGSFQRFLVLFWGLGPKVPQGGPRDPPRVPPGSKLLQNASENDSNVMNKCCPEAFWRFSKTHVLSMFRKSSGLFFPVRA